MATVPSPNVAQVSGVTPEGASLAQGLAQTELTKNVESFRAGNEQALQSQQIAASQAQLDQQLKQQRELEQYKGLLEKEKQDKDLAGAKDRLKMELDERRRADTQALEARKVEAELVRRDQKARAQLALLDRQKAAALAAQDEAAALEADEKMQGVWDEITKVENAIGRISPRISSANDILTKMGEASQSLDAFMGSEHQRKKMAIEMATAEGVFSLLNDLPDGDAPLAPGEAPQERTPDQQAGVSLPGFFGWEMPPTSPTGKPDPTLAKEGTKSKVGARLTSYILRLSGVENDPEGRVSNALGRMLSAMESPGDSLKKEDGKAALAELRSLGVDGNLIGAAITTMRQGLSAAAVNGTISAPDLLQATTGPDGKPLAYGGTDPERMKKKALAALDAFDRNYISGGLSLGLKVTKDQNLASQWVDSYLTPLTNTVSRVMQDLKADGVIDDASLLQELNRFPQARDILLGKIRPLQESLKTEVWQSELDPATKGLFGEKARAGGVDLNAARNRVQTLTENKAALNARASAFQSVGDPLVRRKAATKAKSIEDDFLGKQAKIVDDLDVVVPYKMTP